MPKNITLALSAASLLLAGSCLAEGKTHANLTTLNLGPHTIKDLKIDGPLHVELSDQQKDNIVLIGTAVSLDHLQEQITTDGLAITNNGEQPVTLKLGGKALQNLSVHDGSVMSDRLSIKQPISLNNSGAGNIDLHGMLNLRKLTATGTSHTNISWINSSQLNIQGNDLSQIKLSGEANSINIRLNDNSTYNGQSLRAEDMRAKTSEHAIANVFASNRLSAFATDKSAIYYMNEPAHLTRNSKDNANILALR